MLQRYLLLWLILSSGVAYAWPEFGLSSDPFTQAGSSAINVLIVLTMFCVGLLLPLDEVDDIIRRWKSVLLGTTVQYVSMPFLAWAVVQWLQPDQETATGILIVGCVPGAMASNVLTMAARGNVSFSVSLTTSATVLSPLIVPLALWATVDQRVEYDGWAAVRLMLFQVVLPVVFGHIVRRCADDLIGRRMNPVQSVASLSILSIIAIAVALNRHQIPQTDMRVLTALACINLGGYLAGYGCGRGLRFSEAMRRALTLEVGMQNAGAGIALAKSLFGDSSPAVIPCILYTFGCMLTGTMLATIWQRIPPEQLPATE